MVILSAYDDDSSVTRRNGGGGCWVSVENDATTTTHQCCSCRRSCGDTVLDPAVSERWELVGHSQNVAARVRLTPRERQIVALVGEGKSNRAIGAHLGVSVRTVEGHLNHIFSKMGMESRTELVRFRRDYGPIRISYLSIPSPIIDEAL